MYVVNIVYEEGLWEYDKEVMYERTSLDSSSINLDLEGGGGCCVVRRVPHNELDDDEYVADEGHGIYVLPGECYLVCGEESIIYGNRTTSIL